MKGFAMAHTLHTLTLEVQEDSSRQLKPISVFFSLSCVCLFSLLHLHPAMLSLSLSTDSCQRDGNKTSQPVLSDYLG